MMKMLESDYFSNIFNLLYFLTAFIFALISLIRINISITIAILIMGIITFIIPNLFSKKLQNSKWLLSKSLESLTIKTKDILYGFEVIKNFNLYSRVINIFHSYNIEVEKQKQTYSLWQGFLNSLANGLGFSMFFISLVLGGYLVVKGKITLGAMMASTQLMNNLVNPLSQSINIINDVKSIKKISEKIQSILIVKTNNDFSQEINSFSNSISMENVEFSYSEDKKVLNNINIEFKKGKKYAIVGTSGCGKSTLLKLLLKY